MKTIYSLLLAILTGLLPAMADSSPMADKNAAAALVKLANEKRAAALKLTFKFEDGRTGGYSGAFVSKDGLALVNLSAVAMDRTPTVVTADGKPLKFGSVLKLFPLQGVALMKFDHRPEVIVPVAMKEPEIDETIALIPLSIGAPGFGAIPPVVGPVMVKRSAISNNLKAPCFIHALSLGAGLSIEQRAFVNSGAFAINANGEIVAYSLGIKKPCPIQTLITLHPVAALANEVDPPGEQENAMKFPLDGTTNPIDPFINDPEYGAMMGAVMRSDAVSTRSLLKVLLDRYPESRSLRLTAVEIDTITDNGNPMLGLEDFPKPDPNDPNKVNQYVQYCARVAIAVRKGGGSMHLEEAIHEMKAAIECCPKDSIDMRVALAELYVHINRFDEAATLYREAYPFASDRIDFVQGYESLLNKRGKFEEEDKMSQRVYELEDIYRR